MDSILRTAFGDRMKAEEWDSICEFVTEAMRDHTRPFVTPLMDKTTLVGSGNYVLIKGKTFVVTCQHVVQNSHLDYRFFGLDKAYNNHGEWVMEPKPVDLAVAPLLHDQWDVLPHEAEAVSCNRIAQRHELFDCHEILFFRGYAGENASTLGVFCELNASAYSSQQKKNSGTENFFEMFWEPGKTSYTRATTDEERAKVKYEDPQGFSGSLVWNTRYREVTAAKREWTPADAVVTGMLRRWDTETKTLLVYRIEHIRRFINTALSGE